MFRIDDPSAVAALPVPEAVGNPGFFTEGSPGTLAATLVRASFLNMVQEELISILVAGGVTPSKATYNQVLAAIRAINKQTPIQPDTGVANTYTAVNATPLVAGTWVNGVVQQVAIAHTNTGPSTFAPDGLGAIPIYGLGLQPFQGNELFQGGIAILMKTAIAGVNGGNPICVLLECVGGAQQIPVGSYGTTPSSGDNSNKLSTTAFVQAAIAPGNIMLFAGSAPPVGYLKANGAAISRTAYAALFAAIGTTFGIGDGATTFNVPELRGEFLRAFDDGRGVDVGRVFGTAQVGSDISGQLYGNNGGGAGNAWRHDQDVSQVGWEQVGTVVMGTTVPWNRLADNANNGTSTAATRTIGKARPRNIALLACIKY